MIQRVPEKYPGYARRVYPGFLQHLGFVAMNPDRHLNAHWDYFNHLLRGDDDSAEKHRDFYDEYNAVLDLPAEYYLDTVKAVFQEFALPKGRMFIRDQLVRPQAIRDTALLTHRGRAGRHLGQRPDRGRAPAVPEHPARSGASTTSRRAPATTASSPAAAGAKRSTRRSGISSVSTPEGRSALLLGATGLIGSFLLQRLLNSPRYSRVDIWTRRSIAISSSKAVLKVLDFEKLQDHPVKAEDVYCCLGTTIKQAGSQEAFRRVDFDYPVALARAAARDGAKRLLIVSALGADARAKVFYNRVKGEMEEAVRAAGVPKALFFRPSLLAGPRAEARVGERVGLAIGAVLGPLLGKYRPIHADLVAAAMLKAAERDLPAQVFESARIRELAQSS